MCDNYITFYPSASTEAEPKLFSACSSFAQGLNPQVAGYDDSTPFATLDLGGDISVEDYDSDPTQNFAPCCATGTCEEIYLSDLDQPCAADSDCLGSLECQSGLCASPASSDPPSLTPESPPTSDPPTSAPESPKPPSSDPPTSDPGSSDPSPPTSSASYSTWPKWSKVVLSVSIFALF